MIVNIDSALRSWQWGPVVLAGQSLRAQCTDSVIWQAAISGSALPISDVSNPGAWTSAPLWSKVNEGTGEHSTFVSSPAFPVSAAFRVKCGPVAGGVPSSVTLHSVLGVLGSQSDPGAHADASDITFTVSLHCGATLIATFVHHEAAGTSFVQQTWWSTRADALDAGQIAAIADWSDLRIDVSADADNPGADAAQGYVGDLWIAYGIPDFYSHPEGGYSPDFQGSHALDIPSVFNSLATGSQLPVANAKPYSLALAVLPDNGNRPPLASVGVSQTGLTGLAPNRDSTYTYDQLFALVSGAEYGTPLRVFGIGNDLSYDPSNPSGDAFTDNSGSFTVTFTITGVVMSIALESLKTPQWGIESSYGSNVAATRIFVNIEDKGITLDPDRVYEPISLQGVPFETGDVLTQDKSKGSIKGFLDFNETGCYNQSVFGPGTTHSPTSGVQVTTWTEQIKEIVPQSHTLEIIDGGGSGRNYKVNGAVFTGYKIDSQAGKSPSFTANLIAKAIQNNISASAGQNTVQTITLAGGATNGTLTFQDVDTGAVVAITSTGWDVYTAANLQTQLRTLGGNYTSCTVSGSNGGPYSVTSPTGKLLKLLIVTYTFNDGTNPTVTIAYTTQGGMKMRTQKKIGPKMAVSFATTLAGLDSAPAMVSDQFSTNISFGDRFEFFYAQQSTSVEPAGVKMKDATQIKDEVTWNMAYDASFDTVLAAAASLTNDFIYCRVKWVGNQIGVTGYYETLQYDFACRPVWEANKDSEGQIRSVDFKLNLKMDLAAAFRTRCQITGTVSDYTAN